MLAHHNPSFKPSNFHHFKCAVFLESNSNGGYKFDWCHLGEISFTLSVRIYL